jgi:hypothetical protein
MLQAEGSGSSLSNAKLCRDDLNPFDRNAVGRHVLSAVRFQKIIDIERLRDATAIALRKGDNSSRLAKARFMAAWLAHHEIKTLVPQVEKKYEALMLPPLQGYHAIHT